MNSTDIRCAEGMKMRPPPFQPSMAAHTVQVFNDHSLSAPTLASSAQPLTADEKVDLERTRSPEPFFASEGPKRRAHSLDPSNADDMASSSDPHQPSLNSLPPGTSNEDQGSFTTSHSTQSPIALQLPSAGVETSIPENPRPRADSFEPFRFNRIAPPSNLNDNLICGDSGDLLSQTDMPVAENREKHSLALQVSKPKLSGSNTNSNPLENSSADLSISPMKAQTSVLHNGRKRARSPSPYSTKRRRSSYKGREYEPQFYKAFAKTLRDGAERESESKYWKDKFTDQLDLNLKWQDSQKYVELAENERDEERWKRMDWQNRHGRLEETSARTIQALQDENEGLKKENTDLSRENAELKNGAAEMEHRFKQSKKGVEQLHEQYQAVKLERGEAVKNSRKLEIRLKDMKQTHEEELVKRNGEFEQRVIEFQTKHRGWTKGLRDTHELTQDIKKRQDEMKAEFDSRLEWIQQGRQVGTRVLKTLKATTQRAETAEAQIDGLQKQLGQKTKQLQEKTQEYQRAREEYNSLSKTHETLSEKQRRSTFQLTETRKTIQDLEKRNQDLTTKNETASNQAKTLQASLNNADKEFKDLERVLQTERSSTLENEQEHQHNIADLETALSSTTTRAIVAENKLCTLDRERKHINTRRNCIALAVYMLQIISSHLKDLKTSAEDIEFILRSIEDRVEEMGDNWKDMLEKGGETWAEMMQDFPECDGFAVEMQEEYGPEMHTEHHLYEQETLPPPHPSSLSLLEPHDSAQSDRADSPMQSPSPRSAIDYSPFQNVSTPISDGGIAHEATNQTYEKPEKPDILPTHSANDDPPARTNTAQDALLPTSQPISSPPHLAAHSGAHDQMADSATGDVSLPNTHQEHCEDSQGLRAEAWDSSIQDVKDLVNTSATTPDISLHREDYQGLYASDGAEVWDSTQEVKEFVDASAMLP